MSIPLNDQRMLTLAARLALRGAGLVEPNPMVGAVIVKNGRVIGAGHHRVFGGPHAEREALKNCRDRGEDPSGSEVFVTLEPCKHHGKQPPCTDALIDASVGRVVYARSDPAAASGGGADVLRRAGIACDLATEPGVAARISDPWVKMSMRGTPWIIAKWAQTLDGRIATRSRESKWISGTASRRRVHMLRSRVDGILTGLGTVLADDPMLTARGVRRVRRPATRIVIDPDLELPIEAAVVRTARDTPTIVACAKDLMSSGIGERRQRLFEDHGVIVIGVPERRDAPGMLHLDKLLAALAGRFNMTNIMVEGGAVLLGSLLEANLVDEARVYVAPLMLADARALPAASGRVAERLGDGRRFSLLRAKRLNDDVELSYVRSAGEAPDTPEAGPGDNE